MSYCFCLSEINFACYFADFQNVASFGQMAEVDGSVVGLNVESGNLHTGHVVDFKYLFLCILDVNGCVSHRD